MANPEQDARREIDRLLAAAGWAVQGVAAADLHAARGVALREFALNPGHGHADYLLYVDSKACGVVEAKKKGATLTGVEAQSARYAQGLPASLPAWRRPLPFLYESTGVETRFTNGLDPAPRARGVFAFHRGSMRCRRRLRSPPAARPRPVMRAPIHQFMNRDFVVRANPLRFLPAMADKRDARLRVARCQRRRLSAPSDSGAAAQ